jgi:hypothetical protein
VESNFIVPVGGTGLRTLTCPTGTKVLGGGVIPGNVMFSGPNDTDIQWFVLVQNPNGAPTAYNASVICAAAR